MFTLGQAQENNSHNIYDMLFIEEIIYMILKVFHYYRANMASLFIGITPLLVHGIPHRHCY